MKEKRVVSSDHDRGFAFYHQNEALLFQFLLHECLLVSHVLRKKPDVQSFSQIIGDPENVPNAWQAPQGHLPKLAHYSSLLMNHFGLSSATLCENLIQTVEKAFSTAKKCHFMLFNDEDDHKKLYAKLRKEVRSFMALLFVKLYDFRDNASVLYFLLNHQEQFDALYRQSIIKKTFDSFFPEGVAQAQSFLTEKLSKKGFNHLIPHIEQKLKKMNSQKDVRPRKKVGSQGES